MGRVRPVETLDGKLVLHIHKRVYRGLGGSWTSSGCSYEVWLGEIHEALEDCESGEYGEIEWSRCIAVLTPASNHVVVRYTCRTDTHCFNTLYVYKNGRWEENYECLDVYEECLWECIRSKTQYSECESRCTSRALDCILATQVHNP